MLEGKGLDQLGRAESLILQSPYVSRVLSRLVYVDQNDAAYTRMVANALVAPYDTTPRLGVILVRPEEIEHAASQAGIMLPPDWHSLEARKQLVDVQSVMPRSNTTIAAVFQQAVKQLA